MSYSSRNYRLRNQQAKEKESSKDSSPFFKKGGQHGIQRKAEPAFFQPRLAIGEPGDAYEREAEAMANQVVGRQNNASPAPGAKRISGIQRLATSKEDEKIATNDARMEKDKEEPLKPIQKADMPDAKGKKEEKKKPEPPELEKEKKKGKGAAALQKKAEATSAGPAGVGSRLKQSNGHGQRLSSQALYQMGSDFGHDFSQVTIHQDEAAARLSSELGAQAFTHGKDIYFNRGKCNPDSPDGKRLLAHELTHVVQQEGGQGFSSDKKIS